MQWCNSRQAGIANAGDNSETITREKNSVGLLTATIAEA
jgi:hypothetical protein